MAEKTYSRLIQLFGPFQYTKQLKYPHHSQLNNFEKMTFRINK